MWPFISSLLPPSLFGGFRTGLTDDRGLRWCLNPDYKTQRAPSLQRNTTETLTLQHLQVDTDLHTDTNRHTWTFITIPKYSQNIQPSRGLTMLQCNTRLFHVRTTRVSGDYFDLLQSAQSNQADPEPGSWTGSSTAWISHLSEDSVYQQTGLSHPLLPKSKPHVQWPPCCRFSIDWARGDANCFWSEEKTRLTQQNERFYLFF